VEKARDPGSNPGGGISTKTPPSKVGIKRRFEVSMFLIVLGDEAL
jgi:hypothetical protein